MVGLIHKILFDLIEREAGPEAVADVRRAAGVSPDRHFRLDEPYDDDEWRLLFTSACKHLALDPSVVEAAYAEIFMEDALVRWPMWFQISSSAREFLERQPPIHNGFATAVQDPEARRRITDKFNLEKREDELVMHYRSPNQHCGLYIALVHWVLKHYAESATVEESGCQKTGDEECEIHIRWLDSSA